MSDKLSLVAASGIPNEEWDKAALELGGWFYHMSSWRLLLIQSFPRMEDYSIAVASDDRLIALLPLIRVSRFGFSKAFSMPFSLAGLIGDSSEPVQRLVVGYLRNVADGFKYNCREPLKALGARGLHNQPLAIIDLDRSEEEIFASLPKSLKRDINQKSAEVVFRQATGPDDIRTIQTIYRERMKLLKSAGTYNDALLKGIIELPNDRRKVTIASLKSGTDLAFNIALLQGGLSFYFANSSLPGYSNYCINSKLIWDDIKWARNAGAKQHHLGGGVSGSAEDSLYQYKLRWGTGSMEYYYQQSNGLKGSFVGLAERMAKHPIVGKALKLVAFR